jgi:hypothetical protein
MYLIQHTYHVPDGDILPDSERESHIRVQNRTILNIRVFTNRYQLIISAQSRIEPYACAPFKFDGAHQVRRWGYPCFLQLTTLFQQFRKTRLVSPHLVNGWTDIVKAINSHSR